MVRLARAVHHAHLTGILHHENVTGDGSFRLTPPGGAERAAHSSDNLWVASAEAGKVRLWERATWRPTRDLAFSGDGRILAAGALDGRVRLERAIRAKKCCPSQRMRRS